MNFKYLATTMLVGGALLSAYTNMDANASPVESLKSELNQVTETDIIDTTLHSFSTTTVTTTDYFSNSFQEIGMYSSGEDVLALTRRLKIRYPHVEITSTFNENTYKIVKEVQRSARLPETGVVDLHTALAIGLPIDVKRSQLTQSIKIKNESVTIGKRKVDVLNWSLNQFNYAQLPNRYIVVNIPSFELIVYENGVEQFRIDVIVGRDWLQTPRMVSNITSIKFNPDWTVPPGIAQRYRNRIAREGSGFLSNYVGLTQRGGGFYQRPGPENMLGTIKFEMDNNRNIYLHDTANSQRHLFNETYRLASSGCVRVKDVRKLASWLSGLTLSEIDDNVETKRTFFHNVSNVPVYMVYMLAYPNSQGVIEYFDDVYGLYNK